MSDPSVSPAHPSRVAMFWYRLAALLYDSLLLVGISAVYGLIFGTWLPGWLGRSVPQGEVPYTGVPLLLFQLGWLAALLGFYLYFWRHGGQTLGMRAWRLKLKRDGGGRPAYGQCLVRCATAVVGFAALGLGYFYMLLDPRGKALHDRLSDTEIVRLPKAVK